MSHNVHTSTTQSYDLAPSLLNTPFIPATELKASRNPRNRAKKYPCTWESCNRFFDCPHNVQQHIREAHTGERPYVCDVCVAEGAISAFSRQYGLNRHKRQVHFVGTQSSKAASNSNDEFAGIGAMLAQANFEMGAASSDVEMSESQFHFDAELSDTDVSGAQDSGILFACGECGHVSATEEDTFTHMHASHKVPNTRFCACKICTTMFTPSDEDAANHRMLLRNGAFHAASDASYAQDGPNVTMAPAWSAAQLGTGDATGWDTVDPALLSFSGR
jgi:DNA-directed RNA polymerase subunit M/transcription elongation factor TFIIS